MDDGALSTGRLPSAVSAETAEARAKLFTHGGSQAVRLPKAFRFDGSEVSVRREGDAVILEPLRTKAPPTRAEVEAFYARMDALRGDLVVADPPRDHAPWRDPPMWW